MFYENIQKCFGKLFSDIHVDFFYNSDSRDVLAGICDILSLKYTKLPNFASWRWLSVCDVAIYLDYLRLAYMFFYYIFLSEKDQTKHKYCTKVF